MQPGPARPYETSRVPVRRLPHGTVDMDRLAVEEPLEIRVDGTAVAVTMRTPGHDEELALGFCLSEGLRPLDARPSDDLAANIVEVDAPGAELDRLQRSFYTSSSCGVCGKGALEAVAVDAPRIESDLAVPFARRGGAPRPARGGAGDLRAHRRPARDRAVLRDGELVCVREDVGRHNAMDKVVGWALREGRLPLSRSILCVSGRLSFELVQKAAVAGCPVLVAVGAPSSLAVELAADRGMTLCGFVRGGRDRLHGARPDRRLTEPRRARHLTASHGVLLVGGASARFGSPKALARFRGETLAERGARLLAEVCDEVLVVGKDDGRAAVPRARRRRRVARARARR